MTDVKKEPRPLVEVAAEAYLRAARWNGYTVPVELEDGDRVTVTLEGLDEVRLERAHRGEVGLFAIEVKARPSGIMGPEHDGALQAELADAHRHATEPQPELGGKSPADLILQVLEAARRIDRDNALASIFPGGPANLRYALDALDAALDREAEEMGQPAAGHWEPATWKDVKAGDLIRVGGQHEAEVEVAMEVTWLGSGAAQVPVKLKGRGHYTMPPSGPVEVWRPSLPDWAAQAYLTMVEGGLTHG